MIKMLLRRLVNDNEAALNLQTRQRYGKVASWMGIFTNFLLFAMKITVGFLFNSISIVADAVNNLSDSSSSLITLVGFKMSSKPADAKHPYGHARSEYISGFIVSIFILFLGFQLLMTSVEKIWAPEPMQFSYISVGVLVLSIFIKLWQGRFYKIVARRIESSALEATATDSFNDVFTTAAVLLSLFIAKFTGWQVDAYMGILVAGFIVYSGIRSIIETLNPLLGCAPEEKLVQTISEKIKSYKGVLGFHDLVVHNYGPDQCFASVHVEVPNTDDIMESHDLIDNIERDFSTQLDIHMVIHLDPVVVDDELTNELRHTVHEILKEIDPLLTMHDFRFVSGATHSNLIFDVVVPNSYKLSDDELRETIDRKVKELNPTYFTVITLDRNYVSTTETAH